MIDGLWFNRLLSGFCGCSCVCLFCLDLLFLRFGLCNNWLVSGLVRFVGFLLMVASILVILIWV